MDTENKKGDRKDTTKDKKWMNVVVSAGVGAKAGLTGAIVVEEGPEIVDAVLHHSDNDIEPDLAYDETNEPEVEVIGEEAVDDAAEVSIDEVEVDIDAEPELIEEIEQEGITEIASIDDDSSQFGENPVEDMQETPDFLDGSEDLLAMNDDPDYVNDADVNDYFA